MTLRPYSSLCGFLVFVGVAILTSSLSPNLNIYECISSSVARHPVQGGRDRAGWAPSDYS